MPDSLSFSNPDDFEKHIATLLKQQGYEIIMPPENTRGYDIELNKNGRRTAVQVKNHKAKCNVGHLRQFHDYLELPIAERFHDGLFISASSFSQPALTYFDTQSPSKTNLAIYKNGEIIPYPDPTPPPPPPSPIKYIGVFTCKGGSGKTTTAAHLAGAFALIGYDVILLDLDPDKNLRKLFLHIGEDESGDASLYVPPRRRDSIGATITVLNHDDWDEKNYKDIKIVICDCSPVLSENPQDLIKKFDYCITPITLNPLGIAKNADVVIRTFQHVREKNNKTEMFVVLNAYDSSQDMVKRNEIIFLHLKNKVNEYAKNDPKCKLIYPNDAKIRYSRALLHWGYHVIDGSNPQLAFNERGGISHP
ncbi:MAG TPA: restriction endonuclease [Campylobacterales bacterium]|nr:restriction endonuclease [Campylobacterales bacterium]